MTNPAKTPCPLCGSVASHAAGCYIGQPDVKGTPETLADELFTVLGKMDLAAAVKHLRDWTSYIDDHHRQKYADLIEAQSKLIATLSAPAERLHSCPCGVGNEPCPGVDGRPLCASTAPAERLTGEAVAPQPGWLNPALDKATVRAAEMPKWMTRSEAAAPAPTAGMEREHLAHDSRVYFICESCEEHNPEGAVGPRSDIAVMPDGTWLCDGCYSDCDKSAYGLIASDVNDFEFPRFEDLPRPAPYGIALSAAPAASGADKQERKA